MLCFCFDFLRLVYAILPVLLDCPFLIPSSVISYVKTKREDFNFVIINVSHLDSNIPTILAYGVDIVQLIR